MTKTTVDEIKIGRRTIAKGDVLKFERVRGEFEFMKAYVDDAGLPVALLVVGGVTTSKGVYRSTRMFAPERISRKFKASTLVAKGKR